MAHAASLLLRLSFYGAVLAMVAYAALYLVPLPAPPSPRPLPESTKLVDREGPTLYESAGPADAHYTYVALEEIPQRLKQAVIATEDASFYSHPGVDVAATLRAAFTNVRHGELRSGGSTITQQLARNLYFDPRERVSTSPLRKLREALLALRLDRSLSKEEILERYLT